MRRLYPLAVCLAGCAVAGKDGAISGRPDGSVQLIDSAMVQPDSFVPLPDAPPGLMNVTMSQSNTQTVAPGIGVACGNSTGTADNTWYRVFKLSDYGVNNTLHLTEVSFMVDYAKAGSGTSQNVTVILGTYSGALDQTTLDVSKITQLTSKGVSVPNGDSTVTVPPAVVTQFTQDVPAGSNLIVEVAAPDGETNGNKFYIGVSNGGESHPGYVKSSVSACAVTTPTTLASIGHADNAVILTVSGNH